MEKPAFLNDVANSEREGLSQDAQPKGANIPRKRNVLGRGLSALMTASAVSVELMPKTSAPSLAEKVPLSKASEASHPHAAAEEMSFPKDEPLEGGLIYLSIDRVSANKGQPRQNFQQEEIDRLAQSIKTSGLLQPIVVRRRSSESGPLASYEIVAGERRWRAAKQAGLVKIPALLKQISDREALELGIVENVQRADLNPIEEALAYQRLIGEFGASQSDVAASVGRDRASIANALRLLKLPDSVQKLLVSGELSAGHGRALLTLGTAEEQVAGARRILQEGLSVRAAEALSAEAKTAEEPNAAAGKTKPQAAKSPNLLALEERLRRALGTKVKLSMTSDGKGELRVSFFSSAELESLLERLNA